SIGSGTFFHYFPTKVRLLLAILALGTAEAGELAGRLATLEDRMAAIEATVDQAVADAADPRVGAFVLAAVAVLPEPQVGAALQADDDAHRALLTEWLARAQDAGQVRTDLPAARLASWLRLLLDGFLERIATEEDFTAEREEPVLREAIARLLQD